MKNHFCQLLLAIIGLLCLTSSCSEEEQLSSIDPINWKKRMTRLPALDSLTEGTTYLSVYSQIYSITEHRSLDLTVTVSMRNVNQSDTIYLDHAKYYDTSGKLIRTYFDKTVFIAPLETVEIVIDKKDRAGGSGANFLFDWKVGAGVLAPFFEAVMISTDGSKGISFVTDGQRIQ